MASLVETVRSAIREQREIDCDLVARPNMTP